MLAVSASGAWAGIGVKVAQLEIVKSWGMELLSDVSGITLAELVNGLEYGIFREVGFLVICQYDWVYKVRLTESQLHIGLIGRPKVELE